MSSEKKPRVVLAFLYPTEHGIDGHFQKSLLTTLALDMGRDQLIQNRAIVQPSGPSLDISRNECSSLLLASDNDWIMFLDSDMHWNPGDLLDFLDRNTRFPNHVTAGVYLVVHHDRQEPCIYGVDGEPILDWTPGEHLLVAGVGAGAMLIHRSTLESILETSGPEWFSTPGRGMNEDFSFCARLHEHSIPLVVDTGFEVGHRKKVTYTVAQWRMERAARQAAQAQNAAQG